MEHKEIDPARIKELQTFAESYLTRDDPTHTHLRSFNRAVQFTIPELIEMQNEVSYQENGNLYRIHFENIRVVPPTYLDSVSRTLGFLCEEAHLRNMTYMFSIICKAIYTLNGRIVDVVDDYLLSSVPCMTSSVLCNRSFQLHSATDEKVPAGCFVVRGSLKVIPPLKRANWNVGMIRKERDSSHLTLEVRSSHESRKSFSTYNTSLILYNVGNRSLLDKKLEVHLSFFVKKKNISAAVLFQSLGWSPRDAYWGVRFMAGEQWSEEMANLVRVLLTDLQIPILKKKYDDQTPEEKSVQGPFDPVEAAISLIVECSARTSDTPKSNREFAMRGLSYEFLPQVGIPNSNDGDSAKELNYRKGIEISAYIFQLIQVAFGKRDVDSRDHFNFCRMDSMGTLLSSLYRQVYAQFLKQAKTSLKNMIEKEAEISIMKTLGNGKITARICYCFSTGAWGSRRSGCNRRNVSQALQLFNPQSRLGHMAFFYTTRNTEGKHVNLRQIHPSQAFKICPAATPEGKQCGLVSTGVCGFMLSNGTSASLLTTYLLLNPHIEKIQNWRHICNELGVESMRTGESLFTPIRVNGTCIGFLDRQQQSIEDFYDWFSVRRQRMDIDPFTSISFSVQQISIFCDADRVVRFVVKISEIPRLANFVDLQPSPLELVSAGVGIILDSNEEGSISICAALTDENIHKYDFCELDPSCILSILGAQIPFANFNQAPRNTYQVAMGKAAASIGIDRLIMQKQRFELSYPQRPLTDTMIARAFHPVFESFGVNCMVAVKMQKGYAQEDSTVVNKAFLERGGLATNHTCLYKDSSRRGSAADRQLYGKLNPRMTSGMKTSNYSKITKNGLPAPGELIENGDVVISKADRSNKGKNAQFRCTSVIHSGPPGRVEHTICTFNSDAQAIRKVTVRAERRPEVGDKISSRHGQKTTIGLIERQEDLPFDPETGCAPDVIISSTAFPSRMTRGMWNEFLTSALAAKSGVVQDATPFREFDKEMLKNKMKLLGDSSPCIKMMRDGRTGRLIKCKIYTGPVYLQVLKQYSRDKLHARARGPRNILTRAPLEGRARDGGLRIGYMTRDCLLAYAAPAMIHSRMLLHSDVSKEYFCKRCGFLAIANVTEGIYSCKACGPYAQVREVTMSRANAILIQELQALMVSVRLQLKDMDDGTEKTKIEQKGERHRGDVLALLDAIDQSGALDEYAKNNATGVRPIPVSTRTNKRTTLTDFF